MIEAKYGYSASLDTKCIFQAVFSSLNDNSMLNYISGFKAWKNFAKDNDLKVFPVSNSEFSIFLIEALKNGASWATLNKYICAAKYFHKILGLDKEIEISDSLELYLKKFCRQPNAQKRPIEVTEVYSLMNLAKSERPSLKLYRDLSLVIFGYFGFCRFDDYAQIKFSDLSIEGNVFTTVIRAAKNDKHFKGQQLSFELDSQCSSIFKGYLRMSKPKRGNSDSYLFLNLTKGSKISEKLSYKEARDSILNICVLAGLDVGRLGTHSFRIGAASVATRKNVNEKHIEKHGRWAPGSSAKNRYQRVSKEDHIIISRALRK